VRDDKDSSHGSAVRDAVQEARETSSGAERGREISEAARSALGKPEQAVVAVSGLLTSLAGTHALVTGPAGETAVTLTEATRFKTRDDADATLADVTALLAEGPLSVRARGRIDAAGALVALRLEVREDADEVINELEGVIDTVAAGSFTLVTRASTAPTGSTATTTATTSAPTGSTATTTAATGRTYTVVVGATTTIRRNDATATVASLKSGDEVEARGTLDGTTLTATRVLADGPALAGAAATTTAPAGTTTTTTTTTAP